jgi:hypothetical protein
MIHAFIPGTPVPPFAPTASASGVAKGAGVTPVCSCGLSKRVPKREQWSFLGRETHWGYTFLVWIRDDGTRYARVMH